MIDLAFNPALQISEATPQGDLGKANINHIRNARLGKYGKYINSYMTYLYGNSKDYGSHNFPLLLELDGKGRKMGIDTLDGSFKTKVFGKPKVTDSISRLLATSTDGATGLVGARGTSFKMAFKTRFFRRNEVISTGGIDNVQVHLQSDGVEEVGVGWVYTAKVAGLRTHIPVKYLMPGVVWASGPVVVSLYDSRGTVQRRPSNPFDLYNQISVIRQSYAYAGNVSKKKLTIPFEVDGKRFEFWVDWEYYYNEMLFKVEINDWLIFSEINRLPDGTIINTDADTEQAAPMFAGLWQQMPYEVQYTQKFTKAKLDEIVNLSNESRDIIGNNNTGTLTFLAGTGLLEEVNEALYDEIGGRYLITGDKFVRGNDPKNMQIGNYFTEYLHSSGKLIRFIHEPAFDRGSRTLTSPRDPHNPSRSVMSYSGMLLNDGQVEVGGGKGKEARLESNVTLLYEEGREYQEWYVLGGAQVPFTDIDNFKSRATDVDASAQHKLVTYGIHVHVPQSCIKITKKISA